MKEQWIKVATCVYSVSYESSTVGQREAPYWVLSDLASFPGPPSFSLFAVQKTVSKWGKPISLYEEKVMCYQLELVNVL